MLDQLIKKHFPFEHFNEGQYDVIYRTVEAIQSGKKHIIISAPTGIGKSAIATTVHKVLADITPGYRTSIITVTKALQDQYLANDKNISSLMGKQNYGCHKGCGYYNSAKCKIKVKSKQCSHTVECSYVKTRDKWLKEDNLRITNSAYQIISPTTFIGIEEHRPNLLVIDECHELEDQLVAHATLTIDTDDLKSIAANCGSAFVSKFSEFINEFIDLNNGDCINPEDNIKDLALIFGRDIVQESERLSETLHGKKKDSASSILMTIDELDRYAEELFTFAEAKGEWIVDDFAFAKKVSLSPVYASQVVQKRLYDKADVFIHMSATVCGAIEYANTLGIDPKTAKYIEVDNPIDKDRRRVHALNLMKISAAFDDRQLGKYVDKIIDRHPKENGVIHTVSFALAKKIKENSKYADRMYILNDRNEIQDLVSKKDINYILLSPSVEAGYDFKDDQARWQIIAKVPYGYLGSPRIKLNTSRNNVWYARKAIIRLIQAAGRATRGINDHSVTYIIDANFERLFKTNESIFPQWFKDSLSMMKH